MKTKNIYPVYESVEESWERFTKIYELTDTITGDGVVPVTTEDICMSWTGIAMYWKLDSFLGGKPNFMYEAIYHVRYRRFSTNVNTHEEMMLTLLIEDELCRCGYAFQVWSHLEEFEEAYQELLFPQKGSQGWKEFCPWYMKMYLAGNMANRIMLKGKRPIDWGNELDCDRATFPYGPDYMSYRVTVFEQAMEILLPESSEWYEEWMDIEYITECIKARYKMDFTNDSDGFDNLIGLTVERKYPKVCASYLYRLNNITPELLDVLWGENTQDMMQKCFMDVFRRYRAAKRAGSKRSNYSHRAVQQSWLYHWVAQMSNIEETKPSSAIKKAMFKIELNI